MVSLLEDHTDIWTDPGAGTSKQSLVDLSVRGGSPIDNDLDHTSTVVSNRVSFTSSSAPPVHQTASRPDVMLPTSANLRSLSRTVQTSHAGQPATIATAQTQENEQLISRLDSHRTAALSGRMGKRETCIVNAAIMAHSYGQGGPKRFNKPMVVDIDLPVCWPDEEARVAPASRA